MILVFVECIDLRWHQTDEAERQTAGKEHSRQYDSVRNVSNHRLPLSMMDLGCILCLERVAGIFFFCRSPEWRNHAALFGNVAVNFPQTDSFFAPKLNILDYSC